MTTLTRARNLRGRFSCLLLWRPQRSHVMIYGIMFILMMLCFMGPAVILHRSFLNSIDGVDQQYPFFLLEGIWLRDLLSNIFITHTFQIPQWTPLLGYGTDYITALASNLGNPVYLISVFSTPQNGEALLSLAIILQIAFASVVMSRFCLLCGMNNFAAMIGGLTYAFSGFTAFAYTQIFFMTWLALAPLVLLGIEKIIRGKHSDTFIIAVAFCFLSSVSLSYQICLLLVVYCLVRFFLSYEEKTIRGFLLLFVRVFIPLVFGALAGMAIFLPTTASIVGQTRLGIERSPSFVYDMSFYRNLIKGMVSVQYPGVEGSLVGCLAVSSIALMVLVSIKKRNHPDIAKKITSARVMAIVLGVLLVLPAAGSLLNGLAYPSLRWTWALSLFLGYITALFVPLLPSLTRDERLRIGVVWLLYAVACAYCLVRSPSTAAVFTIFLIAGLFVLLFAMPIRARGMQPIALFALALSCLVSFGGWMITGEYQAQIKLNGAYGVLYEDTPLSILKEVDQATVERYGSRGFGRYRNSSIAAGLPGDTFYNSLYNNYIDEQQTSLGLASHFCNFTFDTFDSRLGLETLSGVNYLVASSAHVPTGYCPMDVPEKNGFMLYRSNSPVPLGSLHSVTFTRELYDSLNMVQRQNLLLFGVVLESGVKNGSVDFDTSGLGVSNEYTLDVSNAIPDPNISLISAHNLVTLAASAQLNFMAEIPSGKHTYLVLHGLHYNGSENDFISNVSARCGDNVDTVVQANQLAPWYGDKHDWVLNLGTSEYEREGVALILGSPGQYEIGSAALVIEDEDTSAQLAEDFVQEGPTNLSFESANVITGSVDIMHNRSQTLLVRVPYGEGWHATVDGDSVPIERADIGFMALPLNEGSHTVRLEYKTPHLASGITLSAIGILSSVVYVVFIDPRLRESVRGRK